MGVAWGIVWLWGAVGLVPLAVYALVWLWPHSLWSSRVVPSDCFRLLTGVAFAGMVHPSLGLLAGVSALWWAVFAMGQPEDGQTQFYRYGTPRLAGGTLWPLVAMAVWVGLQVPAWAFRGVLGIALSVGIVQVAMGLGQRFPVALRASQWVLATRPGMIHGTIGHRTGYGIYLAILTPLALGIVPPPWNWVLVAVYGIGIVLSDSMVAALAVTAGVLWVVPGVWTVGAGFFLLGALYRFGPNAWSRVRAMDAPWYYFLMGTAKPWVGRVAVWSATWPRCWTWPEWLIGHGAGAFQLDARRWLSRAGLREVYAEAHNDYLETLYEYGLLGYVAFGGMLWTLWPALHGRDPFVGMLLAGAVAMTLNFPMRVAPTAGLVLVAGLGLLRMVR